MKAVRIGSSLGACALAAAGAVLLNGPLSAAAEGSSRWYALKTGESEHLHGIFALDGCHVWAVGEETGDGKVSGQAVIRATDDGGKHWHAQSFPSDAALNATMNRVLFTSEEEGYAVGENNQPFQAQTAALTPLTPNTKPNFLRTNNGGETWVNLTSNLPLGTAFGTGNDIEGLSARGDDVWIALSMYSANDAMSKGLILHSGDRGNSWTIQLTNGPGSGGSPGFGFSSVSMASESDGWATTDDGKLYRTTDGGSTWNLSGASTKNSAEQVFAVSEDKAVIAEDGGVIEYITNGTTLHKATMPSQVGTKDLTDVAIGEDGNGYATGELNGYVLKTKDGGKTWTWQDANTKKPDHSTNFNGVTVAEDTTFAWIAGEGGHINANTPTEKACES
jgi:photosystem II stability/assembly factor-like uncharacterized protein